MIEVYGEMILFNKKEKIYSISSFNENLFDWKGKIENMKDNYYIGVKKYIYLVIEISDYIKELIRRKENDFKNNFRKYYINYLIEGNNVRIKTTGIYLINGFMINILEKIIKENFNFLIFDDFNEKNIFGNEKEKMKYLYYLKWGDVEKPFIFINNFMRKPKVDIYVKEEYRISRIKEILEKEFNKHPLIRAVPFIYFSNWRKDSDRNVEVDDVRNKVILRYEDVIKIEKKRKMGGDLVNYIMCKLAF